MFRGMKLDGHGKLNTRTGALHLSVTAGTDELEYDRDADGHRSVKGTWNGYYVKDQR